MNECTTAEKNVFSTSRIASNSKQPQSNAAKRKGLFTKGKMEAKQTGIYLEKTKTTNITYITGIVFQK